MVLSRVRKSDDVLLLQKSGDTPSSAQVVLTFPVAVSNTVTREAVQLAEGSNSQKVHIYLLFCFVLF